VLALANDVTNDKKLGRVGKLVLLILSPVLMGSAFLPLRDPNPPRSLILLGAGLVSLATLSRQHFADEK